MKECGLCCVLSTIYVPISNGKSAACEDRMTKPKRSRIRSSLSSPADSEACGSLLSSH
jgi:hypothetical protein